VLSHFGIEFPLWDEFKHRRSGAKSNQILPLRAFVLCFCIKARPSQRAEKLASFEGAQLKLCRNNRRMKPAGAGYV
jgi:hypothetical protein